MLSQRYPKHLQLSGPRRMKVEEPCHAGTPNKTRGYPNKRGNCWKMPEGLDGICKFLGWYLLNWRFY